MTQHEYYGSHTSESGLIPDLTNTHEIVNGRLVPKRTAIPAHPDQQPTSYEPRQDADRPARRSRRGLGKTALTLLLAGGMLYGGDQVGAGAAHWAHENVPWVGDVAGFIQQMTGNK